MENSIPKMRPELVPEWSEKNAPLTRSRLAQIRFTGGVGHAVMNGRPVQRLGPTERNVPYAITLE